MTTWNAREHPKTGAPAPLSADTGPDVPRSLDDGQARPLGPETPAMLDEVTRGQLLALLSDLVETRETTGCPRVAAHCDALGAIVRRHEPNGYV